jgi:protein-tyrosine-phosphatase
MRALPETVLFACNFNHVRSPMAAAMMRQMFGHAVYVESCGLKRRPSDECDPMVVAVMDEVGLDLAGHAPRSFDDLDSTFDLVISLTPEAHHRAMELSRGRAVALEYWPTPDPTLGEERSREAALSAYRALRDGLRARLKTRFGSPSTPGG